MASENAVPTNQKKNPAKKMSRMSPHQSKKSSEKNVSECSSPIKMPRRGPHQSKKNHAEKTVRLRGVATNKKKSSEKHASECSSPIKRTIKSTETNVSDGSVPTNQLNKIRQKTMYRRGPHQSKQIQPKTMSRRGLHQSKKNHIKTIYVSEGSPPIKKKCSENNVWEWPVSTNQKTFGVPRNQKRSLEKNVSEGSPQIKKKSSQKNMCLGGVHTNQKKFRHKQCLGGGSPPNQGKEISRREIPRKTMYRRGPRQ